MPEKRSRYGQHRERHRAVDVYIVSSTPRIKTGLTGVTRRRFRILYSLMVDTACGSHMETGSPQSERMLVRMPHTSQLTSSQYGK